MKKKILILGSSGMLGSALKNLYNKKKYKVFSPKREELDLLKKEKLHKYFKNKKFDLVINAAAKVGGIYANYIYPVDFLLYNLNLQNNIIEACKIFRVKKLIFIGSSCIYPKFCPQPIKESYLLTGSLEKTNEAYAIAKIAGIKLIDSYNKQFNTNFISVMPTNLFGPKDQYDKMNSHVVAALIKKMVEAKKKKLKSVEIWGSGKPKRDFLFIEDAAEAIYLIGKSKIKDTLINIGSGREITINALANKISKILNIKVKLVYNKNFPDGTPRKILNIEKLKKLGWKPRNSIDDGLKKSIRWYLKNN